MKPPRQNHTAKRILRWLFAFLILFPLPSAAAQKVVATISSPKPGGSDQWSEDGPDEPAGQAAQHGHNWRGEDDEGGRKGHQHRVLRHVQKEQPVTEGIERRSDGDDN